MKLRIQSPDITGRIEPVLTSQLLRFIPISDAADSIPFVPIGYLPEFRFDSDGMNRISGKKWVLLDMSEGGWDAGEKPNVLGRGVTRNFGHLSSDEWVKLDDFVRDHPPLIQFKRELFLRDASPSLMPCDYLVTHPVPAVQSKVKFEARPLDVFFAWGYSHPSRPKLHGDIFHGMAANGIEVISEWSQNPPDLKKRWWMSVYSPWYARTPIQEVLRVQQTARISVAMPGAGRKTFRHAESCLGCVMAAPEDGMAWSYPWESMKNCVKMPWGGGWFDSLNEFTVNPLGIDLYSHIADLYDIYRGGMENAARYQSETWVQNYLLPSIQRLL